jgi:hypothetical protein
VPNTSVHFPGTVLKELDELAAEIGTSRNRLIVDACRKTLERRRDWPEGFFASDRYSADELRALQSGWAEFDQGITTARRSRRMPPF